jgi:hypothetical protein
VPSAYDVGILTTAAPVPEPYLEIASTDTLRGLTPNTLVAIAGYPLRDIIGQEGSVRLPEPQFTKGEIKSLTDIFMTSRANQDPRQSLLIHHGLTGTGGSSGSPMVNNKGEVIAIFNAGNVVKIPVIGANNRLDVGDGDCPSVEVTALPNAVGLNYAQRADVLRNLIKGRSADSLKKDQAYWASRIEEIDTYFAPISTAFAGDTAKRFEVDGSPEALPVRTGEIVVPKGDHGCELKAKVFAEQVQEFNLEPGFIYGFIAESSTPLNIRLNDEQRTVGVPRRGPLPGSWLRVESQMKVSATVWLLTESPIPYKLHVYRWKLPASSPATNEPTTATASP